jgi:hypothetical protein
LGFSGPGNEAGGREAKKQGSRNEEMDEVKEAEGKADPSLRSG